MELWAVLVLVCVVALLVQLVWLPVRSSLVVEAVLWAVLVVLAAVSVVSGAVLAFRVVAVSWVVVVRVPALGLGPERLVPLVRLLAVRPGPAPGVRVVVVCLVAVREPVGRVLRRSVPVLVGISRPSLKKRRSGGLRPLPRVRVSV
ncbi:hypothetical protein [Mycetocola saprophilus]|uniref:hypothetical protein n=1 Tax=Mycetocola saprophilus TaxID=76636 RepID=UPI003BF00098